MLGNYPNFNQYPDHYNTAPRNPGGPLYKRTLHSQVWGQEGRPCQPVIDQSLTNLSRAFDTGLWVSNVPTPSSPDYQGYRSIKVMGKGTFGETHAVEHLANGQTFAMKVVQNVTNVDKVNIEREIHILSKIRRNQQNPSKLLSFVESFERPNEFCFVTELLDIDLFKYMENLQFKPIPSDQVRNIGFQIVSGVAELHKLGIAHCDLKPWNIMFVNSRRPELGIKIIDFGNSNETFELRGRQGQELQTFVYRAPEAMLGLPIDEKIDIWSVGITLIELYTGRRFFTGYSEVTVMSVTVRLVGLPYGAEEGIHFERFGYIDPHFKVPVMRPLVNPPRECWYQETGLRSLHKHGYNKYSKNIILPFDLQFEILIEQLLMPNAAQRPTAESVLLHDFFKANWFNNVYHIWDDTSLTRCVA